MKKKLFILLNLVLYLFLQIQQPIYAQAEINNIEYQGIKEVTVEQPTKALTSDYKEVDGVFIPFKTVENKINYRKDYFSKKQRYRIV